MKRNSGPGADVILETDSLSMHAGGWRDLAPALLEQWMRAYYFATEFDLGSSGVYSFSLLEIQQICGLSAAELAAVTFDDSTTQGSLGLRLAIARRWGGGDPEAVMATHGSSEAIHLVMNALLSPGDEVVVLEPVYQQLNAFAKVIGCNLKYWTLKRERDFAVCLEDLGALLTQRTRMVVVNFPHNPCGATLTRQQQQELIEMVARSNAYLVWDGAFSELVYAGERLPAPNHFYEKTITLGTLSKAFGLPGLRVGWLIAPPEVMRTCLHLRDYLTLHLSPMVELIAQCAIENADRLLAQRLPSVRANLDRLREWATQHEHWIEWIEPGGGVCAFPRLVTIDDVETFCRRLAQKYHVLLVPGTCFHVPGHVRLGFGSTPSRFNEGLKRLTHLLEAEAR